MAPVEEQLSVLLGGVEYGDDRTHTTMEAELRERLEEDRPLKVYAGFDPTSVDLHLGHTLPMRKLRQFQDFGHDVTFLIGNFTGLVGDPSDKDKGRPMITADRLAENGRSYADQAFRILDAERTTVRYNADWLGKLTFADVVGLTSKFTVAQFLERDNFAKRWQNHDAIYLSEFMYAIMQAQDAVVLETDVQVGGSDQLFNLMAGRTLQRDNEQRPQVVITLPILVGTDGTQRMSKSTGNSIGINEPPNDMYGKVMSLPDEVILDFFTLVTPLTPAAVHQIAEAVDDGTLPPMEAKKRLAGEIVAVFSDDGTAADAQAYFEATIQRQETPEEMPEYEVDGEQPLHHVLTGADLASSNGEVRRLVGQGAVSVNGERVDEFTLPVKPGDEIRVGRHRFLRLTKAGQLH
ncbi:MAG: tyrosine--tRNA ligase [SAR202 cluster bacterium Casp-Chloro-G1]|nr:MAG: tyrosine--tRNA ligase [SAR202 cluster bacterium Casp-Chloro-G1]